MRLWHEHLITVLPRQQLLGQHRECCALRGKGWGRPHATVNYVYRYSPYCLYVYHMKVINEMETRGYKVDESWCNPLYRGKHCLPHKQLDYIETHTPIYREHDTVYYKECIENLREKGIEIMG